MSRNVLLIGLGAIARRVLQQVPESVAVSHVLVRERYAAQARSQLGDSAQVVTDPAHCAELPAFALECAGHGAVARYGPWLLARGVDVGVVSVGALADAALLVELEAAARSGGARLHVLAGAVAGIDALSAAREGGLDEVTYTSRKPPASWRGTPAEERVDLARLAEACVFYQGDAREAARRYPANANVAATVALAGLGFENTRVRLVADPGAGGNVHRIEARGSFGELDIALHGRPLPDNPKTSTLAALSVVRALRNRGWMAI